MFAFTRSAVIFAPIGYPHKNPEITEKAPAADIENIFPTGLPAICAMICKPPLFKRTAVININGKSVGKMVLNQSKSPSAVPEKTISGEISIVRKRKTVMLPILKNLIFSDELL
ncbi:hypothetical protein [Mediterraneibacter sp.]|uniref:hypothetical protein n=1 Tax=Mediterraneibacter sp. TaxID=2316022 RepID=UPI0027BA3C09|nr:hypothetical protein [Mediterraneibacter sp.]